MPTTEVRERPILFSAPMVNAILQGRKTQTRRVVKPQPVQINARAWDIGGEVVTDPDDAIAEHLLHNVGCPYGIEGDRLWVRETWKGHQETYATLVKYRADGKEKWHRVADGADYGGRTDFQWRPSIFMPRWASRITLEVTDVRVERLWQISESDIYAEGFPTHAAPNTFRKCYRDPVEREKRLIGLFSETWDKLNASRGFGWEANPWVWVVAFRRIEL